MRLLYFAPVPYQSYWQRPHYMVKFLTKNTYEEIYWVDPTITRLPRWSDLIRTNQIGEQRAAEPLIPNLTVLQTPSLPIEPLPIVNFINDLFIWRNIKLQINRLGIDKNWDIGVGRPSRLALWATKSLQSRARFMDVMDDFPAFYKGLSRHSMEQVQQSLITHCDHLFCSQESLIPKLATFAPKKSIRIVPNGYDMQRLPFLATVKPQKEIIGFVGTIAAWFDWELVIEIAQALPHVCIQLIGPRVGYVPSHLPDNIELLPACTVEEAIVHCQNFRVGLIPFIKNQLTESVDPIKYYELRALGIPIWTTAFGSMVSRIGESGVTRIQNGIDWVKLWNDNSNHSFEESEISVFRANNDWNVRFEHMSNWLHIHKNTN